MLQIDISVKERVKRAARKLGGRAFVTVRSSRQMTDDVKDLIDVGDLDTGEEVFPQVFQEEVIIDKGELMKKIYT